jgi:hypothetical protein
MHYKLSETIPELESEKKFCSAIGNCPKGKTARLNIKKKDLEGRSMEVILMDHEA